MERKILHGNITAKDIAHALMAEFNRGNLQAQTLEQASKTAVQVTTRSGATSGGQTALTISIQDIEDGVMIELGQQAWLGMAASLGQTALSALHNPLSLLGRLDDLAQDIENMQLQENIWKVIDRTSKTFGASHELSERLSRITCDHCGTANSLEQGSCTACGAPLGNAHPTACSNCGFPVTLEDALCPNCNRKL